MNTSAAAPAPTFERKISPLLMTSREEYEVVVPYRDLMLQITFMPDQDGLTPTDEELSYPITAEQAAEWEEDKWFFFCVLVKLVDEAGDWIEFENCYCGSNLGALPSFMDHTSAIYEQMDDVVKQYLDHKDGVRI